jgi:hypothetical protein
VIEEGFSRVPNELMIRGRAIFPRIMQQNWVKYEWGLLDVRDNSDRRQQQPKR